MDPICHAAWPKNRGMGGGRQATAFVNRFKGLGSLTLVQEGEFTTLVEIFVTAPARLLS